MPKSFASLIRYATLATAKIVLLKDGCLMSGFRYTGTDLDAAREMEKGSIAALANNSLKMLGSGYMLQFEAIRVPSTAYPTGAFSETVTKIIDHERNRQFQKQGSHFETETYCFVTWQPPLIEKQTVTRKFFNLITGETPPTVIEDKWIDEFEQVFQNLLFSLNSVFVIEELSHARLLSVINLCVNGCHLAEEIELPKETWELDTLFAKELMVGKPLIYNDQYVTAISIDGFPMESYPCILDILGRLPFEYRWSNRFIPLDFIYAYNNMSKEQKKWAQKRTTFMAQVLGNTTSKINQDAIIQEMDINNALQSLHEQSVSYGHYTSTIILRSDDLNSLNYGAREVVRVLSEKLFTARIETRNIMEAFLGSLPGHGEENIRKPLIHSLNLSHFILLDSMWPGLVHNPCPFFPPKSPAVIQAATSSGSPFRLHLHVGDVGHTLVLGPTGSGKSTMLGLLVAQFDRFANSQIFVFDKGRSMYPLIAAMKNAEFYALGSDTAPALCPLASLETKHDITWSTEFIETLILLNQGTINPERRSSIESAILTMSKGTTSSEERTLTALRTNIQDQHLQDTLLTYTVDGSYGQYLDGTRTEINYQKIMAFELEELLSHGNKVVIPTLLYLFHEIEKRITGDPTLIVIDEAWLAIGNPLFAQKLREWLKVMRKNNVSVVLATQSLTDITDSEIASSILDSCPTKILLPNIEAKSDSMKNLYGKTLNLNEAEIYTIAEATPKQDYFYVSPNGKRLFQLNLGDVSLSFIGASGRSDLLRIDELKAEHGHDWPKIWLKERGLDDWSRHWELINQEGE